MRRSSLALAALAASLLAAPLARAEQAPPTIAAAAAAEPRLRTLVTALTKAGLVEALGRPGPFTVFAPTNEAFARVPKETLDRLLKDGNEAELKAVLTYHVVPGRIASTDLLPIPRATTLQGESLPFTLRVGSANVIVADLVCSNGIVHVIDAVLVPTPAVKAVSEEQVKTTIHDAIDRGTPAYNAGHHEACASIYAEAARALLAADLPELHRAALQEALSATGSHGDRAWALRRAFDRMLDDIAFEPRLEAPLPEGFPGPAPLGRVVVKEYPAYRAARSEGGSAFWQLFQHIKKNDIAMTAPVEMTMDGGMEMTRMAFVYERPGQGQPGQDGQVTVLDLQPVTVLSVAVRGATSAESIAEARSAIEARLQEGGWSSAGAWRMLGYNSPFVAEGARIWELQLPVVRSGS